MKKLLQNRVTKNYLLLFLTLMTVEIIFKIVLNMPVFDWSLLRIFIGINIIAMTLSIIFSFCGRLGSNILTCIIGFAGSLYALVQAGFYNYFNQFMSIGTAGQFGAVKDYIKDYFDSFKNEFYFILIPFIFLLLYYIIFEHRVRIGEKNETISFTERFNTKDMKKLEDDRNRKNKKNRVKNARINYTIVIMLLVVAYEYSLSALFMQNELQLRSNKELFLYPDSPNEVVGPFGATTYALLDIESTMFPRKQTTDDELYTFVKPEVTEITDYTRLIDDTAWEAWDKENTNTDYKKLNNYYLSKPITDKNEYTGMFKGKNLIVIMMESVNTIALNEEYYPNISKIANEGWNFTNAFSPRNSCSTGNNEMSGMVSLFTINRTCTANTYKENVYPEAIFNMFNNNGYKTNSFHNYTEQYYYRNTIHKNMGSGKYYGVQDLGIPYNSVYEEWPSDVELIEKALEKIDTNSQFMTWITTVSSHQPYTTSSTLGDLNTDLFKNTKYNTSLKRYMSKLKVLDDAIGTLLAKLESEGILDDTVIVLYGDHYPYGLSNSTLNSYFDYDVNVNNEVDRTPFIIYNSTLTATTYDQYTSYMNILPTIANLFDLKGYDPRLYAGHDILSADYENRVIFADGSWQDPVAFYNATTSQITYYGDEKYNVEYIKAVNKNISTVIKMSNTAITSNYFKALYDGIDKHTVKQQEDIEDENSNNNIVDNPDNKIDEINESDVIEEIT